MKNINKLLILILAFVPLMIYSQDIKMLHIDNDTGDNVVFGVLEDNDGNIVVVGASKGNDYFKMNGLIFKVSPEGDLLAKTVMPTNDDECLQYLRVFLTPENTYLVFGSLATEMGSYVVTTEFNSELNTIHTAKEQIVDYYTVIDMTITKGFNDDYGAALT